MANYCSNSIVFYSKDKSKLSRFLRKVYAAYDSIGSGFYNLMVLHGYKNREILSVIDKRDSFTHCDTRLEQDKDTYSFRVDVDIVLNNAGLQIAYRTDYFATPVEDYLVSFNVNTIAPAMICYHFLPKMIRKGTGRILNTTSGIALDVCQAGYSASKAALDKITIDLGSKVQGTDVLINLTDPGWCRTDLGGAQAPNAPESAIPGIVVGVFVNDGKSGRYLGAQHFSGMTLEDAVRKAEKEFDSPYGK